MNCNASMPPFFQLPSGTDPETLIKLMTFLDSKKDKTGSGNGEARMLWKLYKAQLKEAAEKKLKDDEEAKKKKDKDKEGPKPPMFTLIQLFGFAMIFGLPLGALNLWVLTTIATLIKDAILK